MSDTVYEVDLPNGKTAKFHQGHLKSGNWHGFVYVAKHRVYGTVAINARTFTPSGKFSELVSPSATVEVVEEVSVADAISSLATSNESDDERYPLASAVN